MTRSAVLLIASCGALLLAGAALTQQGAFKPVASVTQIMQAMTVPASNALFDVATRAPEDDEEWAAIRNQAVVLAESGNLLLMAGRSQDTHVWRESSLAMVEAGAAALRAADERDVEAVIESGNLMVDACEICHETHWRR